MDRYLARYAVDFIALIYLTRWNMLMYIGSLACD